MLVNDYRKNKAPVGPFGVLCENLILDTAKKFSGSKLRFYLKDSGIGIETDDIDRRITVALDGSMVEIIRTAPNGNIWGSGTVYHSHNFDLNDPDSVDGIMERFSFEMRCL